MRPQAYTPRIGVGDLLRYNAGAARPVALSYPSRLVDLNGDGLRDLVGTWNYAYRPGWPWDGIVYYPRVGSSDEFRFGDLVRVRWTADESSTELRHFSKIYMHADLADFDGDGLLDLVYSPSGGDTIHVYRNTGRRDPGRTPVFVAQGSLSRGTSTWRPCRAVDLDGDEAIDVVVGTTYLKNTNPDGWPVRFAQAVELDAGRDPCFYDCDADGLLDAVCLVDPDKRIIYWNDSAQKLTGHRSSDMLGFSCHEAGIVHLSEKGESYCSHHCPLLETDPADEIRRAEVFIRHKEGHMVPVQARMFPFRDGEDHIAGAAEIFSDVSVGDEIRAPARGL